MDAQSKYRRYTEDEKAVALATYAATNQNLTETARRCNVPIGTIRSWVKGIGISEAVPVKTETIKGGLATRLDAIIDMITGSIDPDVIAAAPLVQRTTAIGTLIDKARLLREKPTVITEDVSLSDQERASRIAELFERARARRDGCAAPADVAVGDRPALAN